MELLIPGLILVALMVYASTKIKKNAARAYEAEVVETDDFSITKPIGFISPHGPGSEFAFTAHSKDFGTEDSENVRQASVSIRKYKAANFDDICETIKSSAESLVSDKIDGQTGNRTRSIIAHEQNSHSSFEVSHKISERGDDVFVLRIAVLSEHKDEYSRRIEEMLASFSLK